MKKLQRSPGWLLAAVFAVMWVVVAAQITVGGVPWWVMYPVFAVYVIVLVTWL